MIAGPAFAHAQLLVANNKVGVTLYSLPATVQLTFDDNLIVLGEAANQIQVTDPKGKHLEVGPSSVNAATLSVRLKTGALVGKYEVTYRVISADGHPVSSSYPFYLAKKPVKKPVKKK
ncbi:MAG: copper resistance protein CopC [Rhodoluna sp.]